MLKYDDVSLKNLTNISPWCELSDLSIGEDIAHYVMQCPFLPDTRAQMLMDIESLGDGSGRFFMETYQYIVLVLIWCLYTCTYAFRNNG